MVISWLAPSVVICVLEVVSVDFEVDTAVIGRVSDTGNSVLVSLLACPIVCVSLLVLSGTVVKSFVVKAVVSNGDVFELTNFGLPSFVVSVITSDDSLVVRSENNM